MQEFVGAVSFGTGAAWCRSIIQKCVKITASIDRLHIKLIFPLLEKIDFHFKHFVSVKSIPKLKHKVRQINTNNEYVFIIDIKTAYNYKYGLISWIINYIM